MEAAENYVQEGALMDQTGIWMLGVGAFGVVFYVYALYYRRKGEYGDSADIDR